MWPFSSLSIPHFLCGLQSVVTSLSFLMGQGALLHPKSSLRVFLYVFLCAWNSPLLLLLSSLHPQDFTQHHV